MPNDAMTTERPIDVDGDSTDNLVLRTVFLPRADDQELREVASSRKTSKNAIIREAVRVYLERLPKVA